MKTTLKINKLMMILVLMSTVAFSQVAKTSTPKKETSKTMNTYVIEREIPDAGKLSAEELQGISQKSCTVLKELGPEIEWVHSYVTDNKIYCIYRAENEEILRTHALKGGFPINSVSRISNMISPATATAPLEEVKQ